MSKRTSMRFWVCPKCQTYGHWERHTTCPCGTRMVEMVEATDLRALERVATLAKRLEFDPVTKKCPCCFGWHGGRGGRGETPNRHRWDCELKRALAALGGKKP